MVSTFAKHLTTLQKGMCALVFFTFGAALLAYPAQVRDSVTASVLYCLTSLTPSLFPFMVLASYGVRSTAGETLGRLLGPVTRHLFRLPRACGATLVLSFFGGYPAGARGVSLLLEEGKITPRQGGRMMAFCVAPGAAFVVTFLGCGVLGSLRLGWMLFAAVTVSGLLLGMLTGLGNPLPEEPSPAQQTAATSPLIRSVADASSAVVKMCGCILLFAGVTAILHGSGLFQDIVWLLSATGTLTPAQGAACLSFLLEVTGGSGDAAALGVDPVFYAFGLAFGGLCVHLQVFSFFREFPLPKGRFFLFRFLHGFLAAGLFLLLERLFPGPAQSVWAAAGPYTGAWTASTAAGGLSLMLMCLAFLLFLSRASPCAPGAKCDILSATSHRKAGERHGVVPKKEKTAAVRRQHRA